MMGKTHANERKIFTAGGQAVIEGVMMRSAHHLAIAVRKPNGKIEIKTDSIHPLSQKYQWLRWPFIRGAVNLIEMMVIGMKALSWSANKATGEEEEEISKPALVLTLMASLLLAVGLFTLLPYYLTHLFGFTEQETPVVFNFLDGFIKLLILMAYLYLVSHLKDMTRVFEYHGAEHKAVHCYEHKKKLTIANAKRFSRLHPRCGTSFILFVILVGVFLFSLIPLLIEWANPTFYSLPFWERYLSLFTLRIMFLPLIAAVSYEVLKASAKHQHNFIAKIFIMPGMMLQYLTTRKPDEKQLEVALVALKAVLKKEG